MYTTLDLLDSSLYLYNKDSSLINHKLSLNVRWFVSFHCSVPGITILTDIICGFPTELEEVGRVSYVTNNNN